MELSSSNFKEFPIFSQKKTFVIFRETETPKFFFTFQDAKLSYISGNGNTKKLLIFQEVTFRTRKIKKSTLKKFLSFQETELSSLKLKKRLIFQKELPKPENQNFRIFCLL